MNSTMKVYRSPIKYNNVGIGVCLEVYFNQGSVSAYLFENIEEAREYWRESINKKYVVYAPVIKLSNHEVIAQFA